MDVKFIATFKEDQAKVEEVMNLPESFTPTQLEAIYQQWVRESIDGGWYIEKTP